MMSRKEIKTANLPQIADFKAEVPLLKVALEDDAAVDAFVGALHDHESSLLVHSFDGSAISNMNDIDVMMGTELTSSEEMAQFGLIGYLQEEKKLSRKKSDKANAEPVIDLYFVFTHGELVKRELLLKFATVIQSSGYDAAVVLLFRGRASAMENRFSNSSTVVCEQYITPEKSVVAEDLLFDIIESKKLPFMFGPKVVSFLMDCVMGHYESPRLLKNALKACVLIYYTKELYKDTKFVPLDRISNTSDFREHLDSCRSSPSFRRYLKSREGSERVELLLNDEVMVELIKKSLLEYRSLYDIALLTTTIVSKILSVICKLPWWKCYSQILSKTTWNDCPDLHEHGLNPIKITETLKKCIAVLKEKKNKNISSASAMEKSVQKYIDSGINEPEETLLNFRKQPKQRSLLISLLDDLSRYVKPLDHLLFGEILIFDDVQSVSDVLLPDIKAICSGVLGDCNSLLSKSKGESGTVPDLCLVYKTLKSNRRALDLSKSCAGFSSQLREYLEKKDVEHSSLDSQVHARFTSCLPALQNLGILAMTQMGRKRTYSIV
ncbi:uncharacterized protein LOC129587428 isoform X2 [Paramacrobiotus metropolitanus]|nr:uncharacterized protein LOC129587428 isoform X2 [Paramacrobiotus metropolitanus]